MGFWGSVVLVAFMDFGESALAHWNVSGPGGDSLGQQESPPFCCVADTAGNVGVPRLEGGTGGIGQNKGGVDVVMAEASANGTRGFFIFKGENVVDGGVALPESLEFLIS